ncbi:flavodoxin domain-containing protein [Clostridium bornimense]|uniref:flavodoxin family protein n=1 Tax=Clostridium bornimense TaxID=1216932 RepID=UPI001C10175E|nr:flavodoxin domain-containing protein [Clostridium bornimense]MBU5315272.1 flavodoxin domain-containing protein [Clostridium bornimense]
MKISILYFTKSGKTKEMAEIVAKGMKNVNNIEVGVFDINNIDENFLNESKAVVFGTPIYYANTCWQMKKWFDESRNYNLEGKIGAVFATADYIQGGAATGMLTIINHLMVKGMLVYSGGSALGQPFLHLGPVATKENYEKSKYMFEVFGERIANKVIELY